MYTMPLLENRNYLGNLPMSWNVVRSLWQLVPISLPVFLHLREERLEHRILWPAVIRLWDLDPVPAKVEAPP